MNIVRSFTEMFDESDIKIMNLIFSSHVRRILKKISKKYDIAYDELCEFVGKQNIADGRITLDKNKKIQRATNRNNVSSLKTPKKRGRPRKYVPKEINIDGEIEEESEGDTSELTKIDREVYLKNKNLIKEAVREKFNCSPLSSDYDLSSTESESEIEEISCRPITWEGKPYLKDEDNNVYERHSPHDVIGKWINDSLHIDCACDVKLFS